MGKISAFYTMPHPPIIIPEIGNGEEKKISATSNACYQIAEQINKISPDTIIVVTSHGPVFSDAVAMSYDEKITGSLEKFNASKIHYEQEINVQLTDAIIDSAENENISVAKITEKSAKNYGIKYELDHGTIVPIYFINEKYTNYKLVHITFGMLPKIQLYRFGMAIKKAVEESDSNAVLVASGDLSHRLLKGGPYEYSLYGKAFDNEIISLLEKGDVNGVFNMNQMMIDEAGECGLRSFYIMLGAMDGNDIKGNLLSYEGTFGVGYGVMDFKLTDMGKNTYQLLLEENKKKYGKKIEQQNPYVRLAHESLTHYLLYGEYLKNATYATEEMKKTKRGVFVSIKKEGQLRGCIGTIYPTTKNIASEIIKNAVEAGERDPRFNPISEDELEELDFSVDILTEPERAIKEELDPKRYGVIVKNSGKSGLLLPNLDGVNTVDQQLEIALNKAGIGQEEDYSIEKFEVIRYK